MQKKKRSALLLAAITIGLFVILTNYIFVGAEESKPDLIIKDIIIFGGKLRVQYANIGNGNASEGFKISLSDDCTNTITNYYGCTAYKTVSNGAEMNPNEERYEEFDIYKIGTVNLSASIDSDNIIAESNESNNIFTKTITIGSIKPDLIISDIKIEQRSGDVGKYIYVTMENIGGDAIPANRIIGVDIKDLDTGDTYSSGKTGNIISGFKEELSSAYTIKEKSSGIYRLEAKVDTTNAYTESNENNNTFAKTIIIKPDLIVKEIVEIPNSVSQTGIRVKFVNIGTVNAQEGFKIKLRDAINSGDFPLYKIVQNGAEMNPNEERYVDFPLNPGTYFSLLAEVDTDNIIDESNEANNYITVQKVIVNNPISFTKPDLTITSLGFASYNNVKGEEGTLSVTIKNLGANLTNSTGLLNWYNNFSAQNFIFINPTPSITSYLSNRVLPTESYPLLTNESIIFYWSGKFETVGNFDLKFTVDNANELQEIDETNNTLTKTITIHDKLPRPDFIIKEVNIPTTIKMGEESTAEFYLYNQGNATHSKNLSWAVLGESEVLFTKIVSDNCDVNNLILEPQKGCSVQIGIKPYAYSGIGIKKLVLIVDAAKVVAELDENNNTLTKIITVISNSTTPIPTIPTPTPTTPTPTTPAPPPTSTPVPSPDSDYINQLRERIKKLEYRISELEKKLIETEKKLVEKIDDKLTSRLKGKILLQVEQNGEAWYVDPMSGKKFYLRDGNGAYTVLNVFGLGITNTDLAKIPVGIEERAKDQDSDSDGLPDKLEEALGTNVNNKDSDNDGHLDGEEVKNNYNPKGEGKSKVDTNLTNRLKGKILLQVQANGQAWYINPTDGKRYYMKDGSQAYQIMRFLSLGIKNDDLRKIGVGELVE